jgi:hypothetical protein
MRVRMLTLGLLWALGSLGGAEGTVGAARAQEPETQSRARAAQSGPERLEQDRTKAAGDHSSSDQKPEQASHHGLSGLGKDFLEDQKQIWTSPVRLRFSDADWLVPARPAFS